MPIITGRAQTHSPSTASHAAADNDSQILALSQLGEELAAIARPSSAPGHFKLMIPTADRGATCPPSEQLWFYRSDCSGDITSER